MQLDPQSRQIALHALADSYLEVAMRNITREYPAYPWHIATGPGPYPTHREAHPVFYGSFDWHSSVEMHWVIVRLLRLVPEASLAQRATEQLESVLTEVGLAREHAYFLDETLGSFERPYGWGWYFMLATEANRLETAAGARWAKHLQPLALTLEAKLLSWLPKLTYPQRVGMHPNTAFALVLARPWAEQRANQGAPQLLDAIELAAMRFFFRDTAYPAAYEPGGADFLSPGLTEAALMQTVLEADEFPLWLDAFLPSFPSAAESMLTPANVSDPTDGQIAHLHGLNLSRAWGWMTLASALEPIDPRRELMLRSAESHAAASMEMVAGSDYAVEHWLAVYAMLLLTFDDR